MSARVEKLFLAAKEQFDLDIQFEPEGARPAPDFTAPPYFQNLYREMETVKYAFPYMNVRLDYLGEPVLAPGVPKKIRFLLSNNSASISSDRVLVHLYAQDEVQVLPSKDAAVFLSMAHLGSGTKALEFEILVDSLTRCWDVGVAVQDGRAFHGPCHLRINLALPLSRVQEAFDRLDKYVFNA